MGSQKNKDELTVLVTGFGYLPPLRAKDPSSREAVDLPPVRILVHPEPIRVSYKVVRNLVPSLWEGPHGPAEIDFVIHIGMAGPRPVYQIEHKAHRTGYNSLDVDGLGLEDERDGMHGEDWVWNGLPDEIPTDLDIVDVYKRWMLHSARDMDLRISEDPGRYLCDFIYYSSLAHLLKKNRERKVLFLHVPAMASKQDISNGLELTINLIRSIAESLSAAGEKKEQEI
ncbi:Pyroglutamyl-peptidase 1 [Escovopsis weberi]|uniref:Pyroglutamyl-peptidase 1 n=1 Tax=Escovopsis weberi TaxID=150374 RepID=A0A0N0RTC0_ESCWE|nr:Pyroglutamyl-peptidase 1 [Escovopsis weberi]